MSRHALHHLNIFTFRYTGKADFEQGFHAGIMRKHHMKGMHIMANPVQHAERALEETYAAVQPYMPAIFKRIASNYSLLFGAVVFINLVALNALARLLPLPISTLNTIGFAAILLTLYFGWRYLENRNQATGLFVLYTRYSRQKRDLQALLEQADALENEDTLYLAVDDLEQVASAFLDAVEEYEVEVHVTSS